MITRKLTVCFFTENHSAPPDVTTYTSEHAIQVERPQGSTTSRTAPKYGNAELMETGDGTSSSKFSSFVNSKCPSVPWLDVFLLGTQSAHELIRAFMSFPRKWRSYRKCRLSPRARVTPWCRSLVMRRKRFDKILLFLVVNDVDSTVTKLVQVLRLWTGTWRSIWINASEIIDGDGQCGALDFGRKRVLFSLHVE